MENILSMEREDTEMMEEYEVVVVMMLSQVVVAGLVRRLIIRQRAVTVSASETESQRREGCGVLQLLDWRRWNMVPSITSNKLRSVRYNLVRKLISGEWTTA